MPGHRVVFERPDGGVSIVIPAPQYDAPEYLDAIAIEAIANAGLGPETAYVKMTVDALPSGRRWRNAWTLSGGTVAVSIARARSIRRAELEAVRERRIEVLTRLVNKAQDDGDAVLAATLRARRKQARDLDLQSKVDAVADLVSLDSFVPAELF